MLGRGVRWGKEDGEWGGRTFGDAAGCWCGCQLSLPIGKKGSRVFEKSWDRLTQDTPADGVGGRHDGFEVSQGLDVVRVCLKSN